MTPSELKYRLEQRGSKFFTRQNMKFAGDTMRNFAVESQPVTVVTNYDADDNYVPGDGVRVSCWKLYRRRPVKMGLMTCYYFSTESYVQVHGKEAE